jgi:hypothetical protein
MTADRLRALTDDQLGAELAALAPSIRWPRTPDVATRAEHAIREAERRPSLAPTLLSLPSRRRTVLVIAAALLLLAAAAFAAKLVIDIGAASIAVIPGRPTALPTATVTGGDLGRPVTIEEAASIAGFRPGLPGALGPPDRTWVDRARVDFPPAQPVARVALAWRPRPDLPRIPGSRFGAILMAFEGESTAISKTLSEQTDRSGEAIVDGRTGFWTTGPHELDLLAPGGGTSTFLVRGTVVVWQAEGLTYRLETSLSREAAIRLADGVGPASFSGP